MQRVAGKGAQNGPNIEDTGAVTLTAGLVWWFVDEEFPWFIGSNENTLRQNRCETSGLPIISA